MPYDKNGNWDYTAQANHAMFRRRASSESRAHVWAWIITILTVLGVIIALIGLDYGTWYLRGRAAGQGARDGMSIPVSK